MKKIFLIILVIIVFSIGGFAQETSKPNTEAIFSDFKSDGCSRFPEGDYADCCVEHDKAYFVGGSWKMRWRADKRLYKCVAAKRGVEHRFIAPVMWAGVRVFGVPFLPTSFRWGFGEKKPAK